MKYRMQKVRIVTSPTGRKFYICSNCGHWVRQHVPSCDCTKCECSERKPWCPKPCRGGHGF